MVYIYETDEDNKFRYVLGTKGEKTLVCIGVNPSTAEPNDLDPTLKRVEAISKANGYDSYLMFNIYPERETDIDKLPMECDETYARKNIQIIQKYIENLQEKNIWIACGDLIHKRNYLKPLLQEIYQVIGSNDIYWYTTKVNQSGTPVHPLYQKEDAKLVKFNMNKFLG